MSSTGQKLVIPDGKILLCLSGNLLGDVAGRLSDLDGALNICRLASADRCPDAGHALGPFNSIGTWYCTASKAKKQVGGCCSLGNIRMTNSFDALPLIAAIRAEVKKMIYGFVEPSEEQ